MPNNFRKQAYLKVFDLQITYKKAIDMFECMDIIE